MRTRLNLKVEKLIRKEHIAGFIKLMRIQWLGHVARMPKRITYAKMEGGRQLGHPRKHRLDDVQSDLRSLVFLIGRECEDFSGSLKNHKPKKIGL